MFSVPPAAGGKDAVESLRINAPDLQPKQSIILMEINTKYQGVMSNNATILVETAY